MITIIFFVIVVVILAFAEAGYYLKHALEKMDIDVRFSKNVAGYGDTIEVIERAQNNKKLPLPFLILKFEVPVAIRFNDMENTSISDNYYREDMLTMRGRSRHTRTIKATCRKRGYYEFTRVTASTADLFFLNKIGDDFSTDSSIVILPQIISTDELKTLIAMTISDVQIRRTLLTDPFTLAGIREYQPWDPMSSINWTASAKVGDFMVNQNASTGAEKVNIFLNLEYYNTKKSESLLELSISLVYSYMRELMEAGISTALYSNGKDILNGNSIAVNSVTSIDAVEQCGIELARIDLRQGVAPIEKIIENYALRNTSGELNIVISPNYNNSFQDVLSRLLLQNNRIPLLWVMPCYYNDKTLGKMNLNSDLATHYMKWEVNGRD